jgi:hypothetical protein
MEMLTITTKDLLKHPGLLSDLIQETFQSRNLQIQVMKDTGLSIIKALLDTSKQSQRCNKIIR